MTIVEAGQNVLSSSISIYKEPTESFQNPPEPVISAFIMSSNSGMNSRVKHEDNREFVCGWGAAFINITVTFPMNKIMFRQMLHGISTARAVAQLKKEGVKNLYRGILPPLCQKTISTSVMFGMFEQYGQLFRHYLPGLSPGVNMATSASLAGCTEAILCPLERIQTVLQDRKFHGMYKIHLWRLGMYPFVWVGGPFLSIFGTFSDVFESRGRKLSGLFKGVHVNFTRALVSWGIINASYEVLLKTLYN
ncbi:Solute carrier family 25 member 51 [Armadillidium nasatum]|uniref:Solute carrier family 25 member 51 n=1 Tax=Armadillidium nasatum TaxID=96803 RepID=A0A5N5TH40_9CRUS|nr:Solute carrier family 25 member 51 [Armadillidium nasatum]